MRKTLTCVALSLLATACPSPEPTPDDDAGVVDAGVVGCGDVTAEGFCEADILTYCDVEADELVVVDCADAFPAREATCTDISVAYGSDCAVAVGEDCLLEDGTILFCQGTNPGCLDNITGFACTTGLGPCTDADEGTCDGDLLLSVCNVNQPFTVDCASYGGVCSDAQNACVMDAGEFCDGVDFQCAAGLTCTDNTCG